MIAHFAPAVKRDGEILQSWIVRPPAGVDTGAAVR